MHGASHGLFLTNLRNRTLLEDFMSGAGPPVNAVSSNGVGVVPDSLLNAFAQTDATAAQLRGFVGISGMAVALQGITAPGDGNAGIFYWSTGNFTDDNLNTIVPYAAAGQGAWLRCGQSFSSLIVDGDPSIPVPTSLGNATPSISSFLVTGTTESANEWENLASIQFTDTIGHAAAAPKVALFVAIKSKGGAAAGDMWAINTITTIDAGSIPVSAQQGYELDFNNLSGTDFGDAVSVIGPPAAWGLQLTGSGTNRCTSAIAILGNTTGSASLWNRGITLSNTSVELSSFQDFTSSTTSLDIRGTHAYCMDTANGGATSAGIRLGADQLVVWRNSANTADVQMMIGNESEFNIGNAALPAVFVESASLFAPTPDNTLACGDGGNRWTSVWAVNGTIQTSDSTLKTDIKPLPAMLPLIMKLEPITFRWKSGGFTTEIQDQEKEVHDVEVHEHEEGSVEMVNGVATWVTKTVQHEQLAYDNLPVVNPDGTPAMMTIPGKKALRNKLGQIVRQETPDRVVQRTHRKPRMVKKIVPTAVRVEHEGKRTHWGFSAPDVKAAFDALGMDFGGYVKHAETGLEALRPDQLIAVLMKGLQELAAEVAELKRSPNAPP
jgi:Chaperone of endosialidase